jgi:hypothetical protein
LSESGDPPSASTFARRRRAVPSGWRQGSRRAEAGARVAAAGEVRIRIGRMEAIGPGRRHDHPEADERV